MYDFPSVEQSTPEGLLAMGGDLSPQRLLAAYKRGIFPWFNEDDPILWWSPDPRMVLRPENFKLSKSLAKMLRDFEVRVDTAFLQVMQACAAPKRNRESTWISDEIMAGYGGLHQLGYAHSVETWLNGELVGGLYGVAIGRMFYGESMFCRVSNASKVATAYLCAQLARWDFGMIDCQMNTAHLASLGASEIPRAQFIRELTRLTSLPPVDYWQFDTDLFT